MYAFHMAFHWALFVSAITFFVGVIDNAIATTFNRKAITPFMVVAPALAGLIMGVVTELLGAAILYAVRPAFTGVLGGHLTDILLCAFLVALGGWLAVGAILIASSDQRDAPRPFVSGAVGTLSIVLLLVTLLYVFPFNYIVTNGAPGKHELSKLAHVTMMPKGDIFPPTDEHHLVLTTQGMAYYKGQQALGSTGQNYGSKFETKQDEYTLQSVQKHLYWIAPLVYKHPNSFNNYSTPGYVVVDAENPSPAANLVTNHPIHWTQDASWGHNLERHIYSSGYTYCNLLDPTLEIDDSGPLDAKGMVNGGVPYYTVACSEPKQQYWGNVVKKVLLVNATTGEITAYSKISDVPAWVDRIYDEGTINQYMGWYGSFSQAGWPNFSNSNVQNVAHSDLQILYSKVDEEPVFVVEMTSSSSSDQSSTGIALCHTRYAQCDMYPMYGYGIGDNVKNAFNSSAENAKDKYSVATPQLVNISGVMTWFDVYYHGTDYGDQYAAVGFAPADNVSAGAVTEATNLSDALQNYQTYLATRGSQNQQVTSNSQTKTFTAKVARITSTTSSGNTTYYLLFQGVNHEFFASTTIYPLLPFVREGDTVNVTYNETGQYQVSVLSLDDTSLDAITGPIPTPGHN